MSLYIQKKLVVVSAEGKILRRILVKNDTRVKIKIKSDRHKKLLFQ